MVLPEVTIEQGTLRSSIGKNIDGDVFFKFQGIPYAKPPVNELRFKAPVAPETWTGIWDATKEGSACYNRDLVKNGEIYGSENCLFLNVYTQQLRRDGGNLRPVLFWVHGGGFICGSSGEEFYGPDYLMIEDVVLVTINYRLGLLGFLNFDDISLDIPGNAGLKDQCLALKWVQKNIATFGGDPNNVTIFGESAGGASVHFLMLSPMTRGLFHKVIAQSGCALNPWTRGTSGSKLIAEAMNLEGSDEKTIYKTLMQKSVEEILEIQEKIKDKIKPCHLRPFGPVIEKNSKEPFLDQEPIELMLQGKFNQVPFMTGYTSKEGMCFEVFKSSYQPEPPLCESAIPYFFGYKYGSPEHQIAADKIRKFYFGNQKYSEDIKFDILSDAQFVYGLYVTVMTQFRASKAPTYLYRITLETELNTFKKLGNINAPGVSHADDLGYLFKQFISPKIKPGSIEDISFRRFVKLWVNFAKFGNPTPDKNDGLLNTVWKPVTNPNLDFLNIGENLVPLSNPDPERLQFWSKLFSESPEGKRVKCDYLKTN